MQFAEVEVDCATGLTAVTDFLAVGDVGQAINRGMAEAQFQGAVQMGIGYALYEHLEVDEAGRGGVDGFKNYHIVNAPDMPDVQVLLVEHEGDDGPFGAKSVGEIATVPTAPAVVNAVNNALGHDALGPAAHSGEDRRRSPRRQRGGVMNLTLRVNGMTHEVEAPPTARLLDVLRDQLGLTGTKEGCAEGECGACTVIVDGKAVNSCVMLAVQAQGKEVLTVEGLAADGELDDLQQKFVENGAVQCGFCTPGMLMSAKALLLANPLPSEQDIRIALAGNLCRCTGYSAIVAAVKAASGQELTPAMALPGDAEDLATVVTTDPETLAAACEVVQAKGAPLLGAPCDDIPRASAAVAPDEAGASEGGE